MSHENAVALDPEELAAYIDGRLSGARKARVEATLADDEESYEVFLESVRTLEAEGLLVEQAPAKAVDPAVSMTVGSTGREQVFEPIELEPLRGTVSSIGRRASWAWRRVGTTFTAGTLIAALLAMAIGLVQLRKAGTPAQSAMKIDPQQLNNAQDPDSIGVVLVSPGWRVFRSANPEPSDLYTDESVAFRLGIRSVDLRVAAQTRDTTLLEQLTKNTGHWARNADLLASELTYEDLGIALEKGLPADLDHRLNQAEKEVAADVAVDAVMKRRYRAGIWAETGRLAANSKNAAALRARGFRWRPVGLASDDPLRDEAAERVSAIKQRLKQTSFSDDEFAALEASFEALIRQLAG